MQKDPAALLQSPPHRNRLLAEMRGVPLETPHFEMQSLFGYGGKLSGRRHDRPVGLHKGARLQRSYAFLGFKAQRRDEHSLDAALGLSAQISERAVAQYDVRRKQARISAISPAKIDDLLERLTDVPVFVCARRGKSNLNMPHLDERACFLEQRQVLQQTPVMSGRAYDKLR